MPHSVQAGLATFLSRYPKVYRISRQAVCGEHHCGNYVSKHSAMKDSKSQHLGVILEVGSTLYTKIDSPDNYLPFSEIPDIVIELEKTMK